MRISTNMGSGINGDGPALSPEARELLRVTYLRPLRDAYSDMQSGRNSRLSHIIQNIPNLNSGTHQYQDGVQLNELSITGIADLSNKLLSEHSSLKKTNDSIIKILSDKMLLHKDSLQTQLRVAGTDALEIKKLTSLLEKLDLAIEYNAQTKKGNVGLGTSNIMSMACELLLNDENESRKRSSFLLIEEPEAHIHAQRQLRLLQSLQKDVKEKMQQIILTTHSPVLASVAELENMIIMQDGVPFSLAKEKTLLEDDDYIYLERYLDATKANMFFARGVIIVEGPSEELLIPTIAKILGKDLVEHGVSIVNVRGVGLRRFSSIFQRKDEQVLLNVPVACITDRDIIPACAPAICIDEKYISIDTYPTRNRKWKTEAEFATSEEKTAHVDELKAKADGQLVKTFVSEHWTLEYDLAYAGLMDEMLLTIARTKYVSENRASKLADIKNEMDGFDTLEEKASYIYSYFYDGTSKAEFAQNLSSVLIETYLNAPEELAKKLPAYIKDAISYVTVD